jgi:hypothetical protein
LRASSRSVWALKRMALAPPSTQPYTDLEKAMLRSRVVCLVIDGRTAPTGTRWPAWVATGALAGTSLVITSADGLPVPCPTETVDRAEIVDPEPIGRSPLSHATANYGRTSLKVWFIRNRPARHLYRVLWPYARCSCTGGTSLS